MKVVSNKIRVVKNNGFNPVWDSPFQLPFDCAGDMKDLVFVKFAVKEDGQDSDEPLAQYVIPLGCLGRCRFSPFRPPVCCGCCEADHLAFDLQNVYDQHPLQILV